ncbi:MAG: NADH dehydrogenase (quinone) subunit D [Acidobacteria bacterium]|nr:NADH dehydrogenase (quinone) subunit D [Acidobacteriota bacterium]
MADTLVAPADIAPDALSAEAPRKSKRLMTLNMGPQHPSTHGVLRIVLELDGETIVSAKPDLGYLHTGIEKEMEVKTWQQAVTLTDRCDYLANLSNNLAYALGVEKMLGLEVPAKAQVTRVMLCELTRINSHLVWLGTHALDMGAMSMFFYCMREREEVLKLFEMFSGQRMMTSYIRIGGLALDHPRGWDKKVKAFVDDFPSKIDQYESLLDNNPIWKQRTIGVGALDVDRMIALGVSGPMIRAAGVPWDVRVDEPYSSYEKFGVRVPTEFTNNDVYDRYRVRMFELRESCRLAKAAMEAMPEGPFQADAPKIVLPDREKMKTQMESLIYHFKIVTEGFTVPAGEVYVPVESPRGEIAYYMVSDGGNKPYRVHMRTPSFGNLQALEALFDRKSIADSIATLGSMDFVLGDTDR